MAEDDIAGWNAGRAPGETGFRQEEFHEGVTVAPVAAGTGRQAGEEPAIRRLLGELADAAWAATEAMLDAHKRLAADEVASVADAVRRTGQSVDQTESRIIAQYADRAATRVAATAAAMRERRWGELAADLEEFARRRPAWFVLGALAGGFAVSRLLMAAAERERRRGYVAGEGGGLREPEIARVEEVF